MATAEKFRVTSGWILYARRTFGEGGFDFDGALFGLAEGTFGECGLGFLFVAAVGALPNYFVIFFVEGTGFELFVELFENTFVGVFGDDQVAEESGYIAEAFFVGDFSEAFVGFYFVSFVFGGKAEIVKEVPLLAEGESCGDFHVVDGAFVGGLNEGVQHSRVGEFLMDDFADYVGNVDVLFLIGVVGDEFVSRSRHTFACVSSC